MKLARGELSSPAYRSRDVALEWIKDLSVLRVSDEIRGLARIFIHEKVMPGPLAGDAIHLAAACLYLLMCNVRHLANLNKLAHVQAACLRLGLVPPRIATPDLLWESDDV